METKLTLKLNKRTIEKAKRYAGKNNTSVSRMIESYLNSITGHESNITEITPLVKSLSGVVKHVKYDYKKEYADYLKNKYK
jgi:hypothetical protein